MDNYRCGLDSRRAGGVSPLFPANQQGADAPRSPRRGGFTLTELIVAMSIILVLAALAVALLPRLRHQERAARGADQLQRWLVIAKQQALSERRPVGLRLVPDPSNPNIVTELHLIHQPDPYTKGVFDRGTGTTSDFRGADFRGGGGLSAQEWPVQEGDHLEVYGGGHVAQITAGGVQANQLTHTAMVPMTGPTSNYRIIRQPRLVPGESPYQMPQDVGIDLALCGRHAPPVRQGTTFREILFSPAGGVVGKGTTGDKIILWVRDTTTDTQNDGSPTLITIYTRTGLIAAHPVDTQVNTVATGGGGAGPNVSITVANPNGIFIGMFLQIDGGTPNEETARVTAVAGSSITLERLNVNHSGSFSVRSDPFSFTRDPRSSGL